MSRPAPQTVTGSDPMNQRFCDGCEPVGPTGIYFPTAAAPPELAEAMQAKRVPYALHLFTNGWHGMSVGTGEVGYGTKETQVWTSLVMDWLESVRLAPSYDKAAE